MKKVMNILLGALMVITVALTGYAVATGGADAAISLNLVWGYILLAAGVAAALGCALWGMIQNPAGGKGSLLSALLIVVVIGASYFIAAGHTVNIVDLQNNGFFAHGETVITETSILVTYVAGAASILVALVTEIWGVFK